MTLYPVEQERMWVETVLLVERCHRQQTFSCTYIHLSYVASPPLAVIVKPVVVLFTLINVPAANICNPRHCRTALAAILIPEYKAFAVPAVPPVTTMETNTVNAPAVVLQMSIHFKNVRVEAGVVYSVTKDPVTAVAGISTFAVIFWKDISHPPSIAGSLRYLSQR